MARRQIYRGYTMIEVMVTISIIAVAATLMLPVLSNAQESAGTLDCMNNLRTIGFGSEQYCEEYSEMPANIITNTLDAEITGRNFMPSCFLSYEGRPTGAGIMVATRHIPMKVMYCPNAKDPLLRFTDTRIFEITRCDPKTLYAGTALASYIKAGQNMPVPDPRGGYFNIGINPRFSQNQKKPVFTELAANHSSGLNALFGDNHAGFFKIKKDHDWLDGDPRIFEELLNERGIDILDIPEEPMLDPNDYRGMDNKDQYNPGDDDDDDDDDDDSGMDNPGLPRLPGGR